MIRQISFLLAISIGLAAPLSAETARYVRIELPGKGRTLTLAEVEVISGDKNIAPKGKASQSSTSNNGDASRATDGNKSPEFGAGGQTHTQEGQDDTWWELDFGRQGPIDAVEIWNRGEENLGERLDNFSLILLDEARKPVFKMEKNRAPASSVRFDIAKKVAKYVGEPERQEVAAGYRDPKFAFMKGDTVAVVGNGLADRMQHEAWTETLLVDQHRDLDLRFRNLSITGDRINKFPRSSGFTPLEKYMMLVKPDVIFAMFGYNESFDMSPEAYAAELEKFVAQYRGLQPSGKIPRIVLFSPIAHEDIGDRNLPNGVSNNKRLAAITAATKQAAEKAGVTFVDLYNPTKALYRINAEPLTINGIHLNALGDKLVAEVIAEQLSGKKVSASAPQEPLRQAVLDKNLHWHNRYRAIDGNDIWGGRSGLSFVNGQTNAVVLQHELAMLDVMTANRDQLVWARAKGKDVKVDDSNVPPPIPVISNVGGGSKSSNPGKEGSLEYQSGEQVIKDLKLAKGYEINLFADEKSFGGDGVINPVQMQVDTKGRLWAAVWPTYPKWEPLKKMEDALVILHDDDKDGKADRKTVFAYVHSPLGFEFWNGGVVVASQPDILFLKDTDGDDVADVRYPLLQGIGSEDTHHAANNLIFGPDGGIYWQSGIFLVHNHEHPWGASLNMGNSAMYRFDPRACTIAFHANNSPNPHGTAFDYWGYHYANDGTGGNSFQVRPSGKGFNMHELLKKEVRPVAADEIVSSENFPDGIQQNFLVCNTIGYLGLKNYKLHRDGYEGRKVGEVWGTPDEELLRSDDKNFRPTDAIFGEDGALYVSDWHNVIIGHMQHNVRDPNRDHLHGRIYRMIYKDRPLQKPVKIDGEPIAALLKNLEHKVDGVRHRTRVELSERKSDEVLAECEKWMKQWDPKNPEHAHHLLEGLWLHQQHNVKNDALLDIVLNSPVEHARIAAATVKHHWYVADPRIGSPIIAEEKPMEIIPGGVISDTPELTELRVNTLIEQMKYDAAELKVKAGKKVKLTFANPDALPHNLIICNPGTADAVAALAVNLGADGFKVDFLPESSDILHHTKLIDRGETDVLEFT
ncbi:MAG: GDSL-type esterase/lipase family protein, partial [bacterium]|nr:GDSL-type esterase/lipase family protein [bacterium]